MIIRQMPKLYLRGSLSNVTMKNLTADEVKFCDEMTERIANHDSMKKHRYKVMKVLGETIGADYRDDRNIAEQEYKIAIWRAVVNLFYHKHYKLRCDACDSTHRITKTTRLPKAIDQAFIPCPVCNKVKVTDPGNTKFTINEFVDYNEYQDSYKDLQVGIPTCESSIIATPGGQYDEAELIRQLNNGQITQIVYERSKDQYRYLDPYSIINDETQMTKFFGEFVWGYFKQQLRENTRTEHRKIPVAVVGRADEIIVEDIISIAKKMKISINFCKQTQPENGWYHIGINGLHTPPEFSGELLPIFYKAAENSVHCVIDQTSIRIKHDVSAPLIETFVLKPEYVTVLDDSASISDNNENSGFSIQQMSFKTVEGHKMELENHTQSFESNDLIAEVFKNLPEGNCRRIFELYKQDGPEYESFRKHYGYDGEPKRVHIAEFLGITPRSVKQHIANIKHICLAYNLTPVEV